MISAVLELSAILYWLTCLHDTDAYYCVYIVCALAGAIAVFDHAQRKDRLSRYETVLSVIFGLLISGMTLLGNYSLFLNIEPIYMKRIAEIYSFLGGFIMAYRILLAIHVRVRENNYGVANRSNNRNFRVFLTSFVVIWGMVFIYWFFTAFPGNMTPDSFDQIRQIFSGEYSNHHSYWHTQLIHLFYNIGYTLFHEVNAAFSVYTFFQITSLSAIFAFSTMSLYEAGIPKLYLTVMVVIYAFSSYHNGLAVMIWKDPLFAGSLSLLLTAFFRQFRNIGSSLSNTICAIIGGLGFTLLRNNGLPVFLLIFLSFFLFARKHKPMFYAILSVLILAGVMNSILLDMLDVTPGNFTEALTLPVQQISRVLSDGKPLTEEERELLQHVVVDVDEVGGEYNPRTSDPVRADMRSKGTDYLKEHKWEYIKLWIELGLKYPKEYIFAWIDTSVGYWNAGYAYWIFLTDVQSDEFGLFRLIRSPLIDEILLQRDIIYLSLPVFIPLRAIGLHAWMIIMCFFLMLLRSEKEEMLLSLSVIFLWLLLLIAAPVFAEFRYAYPIFTCFPVVMASALFPKRVFPTNDNIWHATDKLM